MGSDISPALKKPPNTSSKTPTKTKPVDEEKQRLIKIAEAQIQAEIS